MYSTPVEHVETYVTAPDHTPVVVADDYYRCPPKESNRPAQLVPPPSAEVPVEAPSVQHSSQGGSEKSQKDSKSQRDHQTTPTDLRDPSQKKSKRHAKDINNASDKEEVESLLVMKDVDDEATRYTLRLKKHVMEHHQGNKRTKICIFVTTGTLLLIGIIYTALVLTVFFTDCFGECKELYAK